MGLVRELPPQRGGGRPPALLCGGGGPCRGHTAVPVALRRRCARRRAAWRACRTIGKAGAELGLMLGAFRRHPRPALLVRLIALCGVLTLWLSCCCCCCCVSPCQGADLSAEDRVYRGVGARDNLGQYEA